MTICWKEYHGRHQQFWPEWGVGYWRVAGLVRHDPFAFHLQTFRQAVMVTTSAISSSFNDSTINDGIDEYWWFIGFYWPVINSCWFLLLISYRALMRHLSDPQLREAFAAQIAVVPAGRDQPRRCTQMVWYRFGTCKNHVLIQTLRNFIGYKLQAITMNNDESKAILNSEATELFNSTCVIVDLDNAAFAGS